MRTLSILSAIIALLLSANICAQEPMKMINGIVTEFGKQEVVVTYLEEIGRLDKRCINKYDHDGLLFQRITERWEEFKGWIPMRQIDYTYNELKQLATATYTNWNGRKKDWNTKSDIAHYKADNNGDVYLSEMIKAK